MKVKQIENKYFKKFCQIIEEYYSGAVEKCSTTMKDASYDDDNKVYVYTYAEPDMIILKLDEFSELLAANRENQGYKKRTLPAVDAVCIDSKNNWYLIEFKNQKFSNAKNSAKEKALNSLWLLFYTYSVTGHISDIAGNITNDIIQFARKHITYIVVCNHEKNISSANYIHMKEAREKLNNKLSNKHYSPPALSQYIDFCFKDAYMCTEQEFRNFILNFR